MKTIQSVLLLFALTLGLNAQVVLQPGDIAPMFDLKNVDGNMVSLQNYSDRQGVVVIFTCNHCPFAVAWEDRIIALDRKYASLGFPVIAINPNDPELQPQDSFEEMIKRSKQKKFSFPYLFDETQDVYKMYGATHTPHVFLLWRQGDEFVVRYVGAIDDNHKDATQVKNKYLESAIEALIGGYAVEPQVTKAIGCTIKDKNKIK
jgi:peroxiredoxin